MNLNVEDLRTVYQPEIIDVEELGGLSMNTAKPGEQIQVLRKCFFSSYQTDHRHFFNQILGMFPQFLGQDLNNVLIVIRKNRAHIYRNFPMMMNVMSKVDIPAGAAIFKSQILDIAEVKFEDAFCSIDIQNGDKIVWLFRIDWSFGLYFDFSEKLEIPQLWQELALCYRRMEFHALYSFLSSKSNFASVVERGWFPFVQIVGKEFDQLMFGINSPREVGHVEERILDAFTATRLAAFTQYWWTNEIFEAKQEILSAGLNAYIRGEPDDIVHCIKNLVSEIEGIIRLDYHDMRRRPPNTKELKEHMADRAKTKFPHSESLGFSGLFVDYLENVLFKSFDVEAGTIDLSRHSVAHGVLGVEKYTKVRALQLILVLDQIYFYLPKHGERESTPT